MLSETEKKQPVNIAWSLLQRYDAESGDMLQRIVANEESWMRSFEPELIRQISERHTNNLAETGKISPKSELSQDDDDIKVCLQWSADLT